MNGGRTHDLHCDPVLCHVSPNQKGPSALQRTKKYRMHAVHLFRHQRLSLSTPLTLEYYRSTTVAVDCRGAGKEGDLLPSGFIQVIHVHGLRACGGAFPCGSPLYMPRIIKHMPRITRSLRLLLSSLCDPIGESFDWMAGNGKGLVLRLFSSLRLSCQGAWVSQHTPSPSYSRTAFRCFDRLPLRRAAWVVT